MKVVKITALDKFTHGRMNMVSGDTEKLEESEAKDLEKAGLVRITHEPEAKMAEPAKNKMEDAPSNKSDKTVSSKSIK